jgi:hypothetical protein
MPPHSISTTASLAPAAGSSVSITRSGLPYSTSRAATAFTAVRS